MPATGQFLDRLRLALSLLPRGLFSPADFRAFDRAVIGRTRDWLAGPGGRPADWPHVRIETPASIRDAITGVAE